MAKKFYVVWAGRRTGVFTDWPTTHGYVDKFPGAKFKSFNSHAEAETAFRAGKPPVVSRRPQAAEASIASRSKVHIATTGLQIYCDGACEPNPGNAGSGIAVYRDAWVRALDGVVYR